MPKVYSVWTGTNLEYETDVLRYRVRRWCAGVGLRLRRHRATSTLVGSGSVPGYG
jgi:hypothetical protein